MFRVTQILRNLYLRVEGLLFQFFGFIKKLFGQVFTFFSKLFGFSNTQYYLENDDAQGIKRKAAEQPTVTKAEPAAPVNNPRRRPDPKMDYYRNLAKEVTKK